MPVNEEQDTPQEVESSVTPIKPATPLEDSTQDINELPTWAQAHIRELRSESKSRRLAHNELMQTQKTHDQAQRAKDQKALDERGEYKKLADELMVEVLELRPMRDKLTARLEADTQRNQERIEAIPEQLRSIVPTEYAPDKLAAWLDSNANNPALALPAAPNLDAGAGSGGGSREKPIQLTPQQKQMAKAANMTEDEYAVQLKALAQ